MHVKFTRNTVANGESVKAGETHELSKDEAVLLIQMCKAVPVDVKAEEPENREAGLQINERADEKKTGSES